MLKQKNMEKSINLLPLFSPYMNTIPLPYLAHD